ncbi:MAG: Iojap-related protein [Acidobacteriales bacterium]|nr:Iojap-related protein [Terriglobales bacterium]
MPSSQSTAKEIQSQVASAITAAEDKKAENVAILQMDKSSSAFTDYFVIASGSNPRQVQAIADEVELRLKREGTYPNNIEGYKQAEWILLDYVHFVVHVFSENARKFYDLERLWKSAKRITAADLQKPSRARAASSEDGASSRSAKRPKTVKSASMRQTGKAVRVATSRSKPAKPKTKAAAKKKPTKTKSRKSR